MTSNPPTPDPSVLAASLSEAQRARLLSFRMEPKQMGIGLDHFLPGMLIPSDLNHPIFGPHYRLNELGLAVASIQGDTTNG